ncbi:MAG: twin-arginine translocation signal domain-containing protein, partial [Anaerolineae bacterium]|nr:twin-arginine translocation signal domain-containing protein [Anaerolineae bacterium]
MTDDQQLSRRDFLKTLGATGLAAGMAGTVGLTAAGDLLGAPMSGGVYRRPWWVRQVDVPTTEIKWPAIQRVNAQDDTLVGAGLKRYTSPTENLRLQQLWQGNERAR